MTAGDSVRDPAQDTAGPLAGMLVVALEQAVAVPFATRQLADLGARVVKVERPPRGDFARYFDAAAGEGMSSWFVWLNRGKQSVLLDIKSPRGRAALDELIARADVFCCNLSPAAVGRLGLAAADLVARHPRLVACQLTGYGDEGPYAGRKAYDLLVQAEAGVLAVTGSDAEPAKAGISVADIAGGMYAHSSVLAALLRRERTGHGDAITLSLFGALTEWMSQPLLLNSLTGRPPPRPGARHASIVPYGAYASAGGDEILIAVQNEAEWQRLCRDVLDLPELATDGRYAGNARRVGRREEVETLLRPAAAALTTAELIARLERAQVAYASVKSVEQVVAHPQLAARWAAVAAGGREVPVLPPPASFAGFAPDLGDVPRLGEHTDAVLAELCEPAKD